MNLRRVGIVFGILALVIIGGVVVVLHRQSSNARNSMATMDPAVARASQNSGTAKTFVAAKGEDYDRSFVQAMLENQQNVAALSAVMTTNAKHAELKKFASDAAANSKQTITDLTKWQQQWGYTREGAAFEDHSSEEEAVDTQASVDQLKAQSADAADKLYIKQVIVLYKQAVDIAAPGKQNASHAEVKLLAATTASGRAKDTAQLEAWQKAWGYHD